CPRFSENLADALKEKTVTRHRVIHSWSGQHALAENSERRSCDPCSNPLHTTLAKRDPHYIRSGSCRRVQPGRAEDAQACDINRKIKSHNASDADQQTARQVATRVPHFSSNKSGSLPSTISEGNGDHCGTDAFKKAE